MSASDRPKWWPISWISTWATTAPSDFVMLGPIVEDRAAVEEDHVGQAAGFGHGLILRQAQALEQAHDVEGGLGSEIVENIVGGEVLHPENDVAAQPTKRLWQALEGNCRQFFNVRDGRGEKLSQPFRHVTPLLAEGGAGFGLFGHGLNRGDGGHGAGDQCQKHHADQHTAKELGIGLNRMIHVLPLKP